MTLNPLRLLKNLFVDLLLAVSGTWVGAPNDAPWEDESQQDQRLQAEPAKDSESESPP